ncbi:hypothetical protein EV363DRAFT_1158040 [Boletus edulis]|uniref:Uncharacterized protein n=1 Tax=Boletus edulis BED1 TaxID=1328754 RepID=A0AAD4GJ65_BOLED|nr:hypothetical protein EV363DRAFT_1158040 [Boletus edulis]KAF8448049.1 hypothetical protein L210DRAFT_3641886 [Boletus edulis BED1]
MENTPPSPQPSLLRRHIDQSEANIERLPFNPSSPRVLSSEREESTPRKRVRAAQRKMQKLYPTSKYRSSLWSPELRFTMRAAGRASHPCLTIQDMVAGKDIFRTGLSQLPDDIFKKVYIAKRASRDCILSRLSANLREMDALEKMKDVILEMHKYDRNELGAISKDLETFQAEALARGNCMDDDIAYRHAIYADEFSALASTNTQLDIMSHSLILSDSESTTDNSDCGSNAEEAEEKSV